MMKEYLLFAGEVLIHMAIIGVMVGVTVSLIAFIGGFGFWLWDRIKKERRDEFKNW